MKIIDLRGRVFGRLTVIARDYTSIKSQARWICNCSCGNTTIVFGNNLRKGSTRRCGCLFLESIRETSNHVIKHGRHSSPEYQAYHDMLQRCYNDKVRNYHRYGGRGIEVCFEWRVSFENFFRDMGLRPSKRYSLDRIENDGNYEPGNCRWATREEQDNNKSANVRYFIDGDSLTISQISRRYNIPRARLESRLKRGDDIEKAVTPEIRYKPMKQYCSEDGVCKSLKEWGYELDIPYRKMWKLIHERGKSLDEIISSKRD